MPRSITCTCLVCKKEFQRYPSELKPLTFCSHACRYQYQRTHPVNEQGKLLKKDCIICGKEFTYYPIMRPMALYCSKKCQHIGRAKKVSGKNASNWKGGKRTKDVLQSLAKRRLPKECAICGWNEDKCDAHHIIRSANGGEQTLKNIIMLCPNHHRLADKGKVSEDYLREIWDLRYGNLPLLEEYLIE